MFGFNWINLFMFLMFYITLPIIYFTSRNEWKAKKNIIRGVTLPQNLRVSAEVEQIGEQYRKELDRACLVLTVTGIPGLFLKHVSVSLTWYMFWLIAVIIVPYIPFVRGWKRLRTLKRERGYESADRQAKTVYVDLSAITERQKEPSPWWYVPPMVMGLIPCVLSFDLWGTKSFWAIQACYLSIFACIVLFFAMAYRAYRHQRAEMVDERTELTLALTRVRHYNWHKMMLWSSWLTGLFAIGLYFTFEQVAWILLVTVAYSVLLLILAIQTEFTVRRVQEKLTRDCGEQLFEDEDRYWLLGSVYYNPNDRHVLKNNRTGMNMTMNLATKTGKTFAIITVLLILVLPFSGIWLMAEEFTPIKFSLKNETLVVNHLKEEYTVELEDILSAEVLDELPRAGKDIGTNLGTLLKGQFRVDGYGTCELCLNPQEERFLVIRTEDETYIFSPEDEIVQRVIDFVKN